MMDDFTKDSVIYDYRVEVDQSGPQHILLKTEKYHGEPFEYTIKINTITNTIELHDDVGNEIWIDTLLNRIRLFNQDLTRITIDKKTVEISIDSGSSTNLNPTDIVSFAPTYYKVHNTDKAEIVIDKKNIEIKAPDHFILSTDSGSKIELSKTEVKLDAPSISLKTAGVDTSIDEINAKASAAETKAAAAESAAAASSQAAASAATDLSAAIARIDILEASITELSDRITALGG